MASEAKNVRILTESEQKQAIKKTIKKAKKKKKNKKFPQPKKNIPKNYLESPFALEWPKLTPEDEEEVANLLRQSCLGLKKLVCKPQWKEVAKYRGAERKAFLKENYQKFLENLDPDSMKKNKEREEAVSHLIFGYNSVMRALEQDRVAGVLVMKNLKPDFVTKAFLPACAKKCIPLVPLNDLEKALRDEETLALPHTCMVLGLKPPVKEEQNRFHPLYAKMCEALNIEEGDEEDSSEEEEDCIENPATDEKEKESPKPLHQLSEVDISAYHLKRSAERGRRAYVPEEQLVIESTSGAQLFLTFANVQTQKEGPEGQANTFTKPEDTDKKKSGNLKASPAIDENVDFSSMILIDPSGDENQSAESSVAKEATSDATKQILSFGPMQTQKEGPNVQANTTKLEETDKNKSGNLKASPAIDENVDSSSMILNDPSGDKNPSAESSVAKQKTSDAEKPAESNSKAKRKRKMQDFDAYVPAITKLVRGNPNRKGTVMSRRGKTKQMKGHPPKLNQQKETPA